MENVIVIVQHKNTQVPVEKEAQGVYDMMALIDSFPVFKKSYDVIDANHNRFIKKDNQLLKRYLATTPAAFEFIIGKN